MTKKYKVAFAGEKGAYSEEAAFKFFGSNIKTIPCKYFSEVFKSVEKKETDFGIIPIENSLEGTIGQNYDLLLKSHLKIVGEYILKIKHCLVSNQGVKIKSIRRVYSHPQALGQCREFLERLKVEMIPFSDTAGSVKMIKEKKLKDAAAIASERAARIYKMKILKRGLGKNHLNFTRFFIISKKEIKEKTGRSKTSIVFSTKHVPGALFKILEIFAKRKINLTKIESRPIIEKTWEYNFYLDFENDQSGENIKEALKEIRKNTVFLKILGTFPY